MFHRVWFSSIHTPFIFLRQPTGSERHASQLRIACGVKCISFRRYFLHYWVKLIFCWMRIIAKSYTSFTHSSDTYPKLNFSFILCCQGNNIILSKLWWYTKNSKTMVLCYFKKIRTSHAGFEQNRFKNPKYPPSSPLKFIA